MVTLTRSGDTEIPFRDTGIRNFPALRSSAPPDRSGEIAGNAIARGITGIVPLIEQGNRQRFLSSVSSSLDDTQLTAGALEAVGTDAQTELGPEDKNFINQLHAQNARINLQVEQGVLRDRDVRASRLAVAHSAIQANPHLAPEINDLFQSRFGRGVGEESLALREESLAAGVAAKKQFDDGVRESSRIFGISTAAPIDVQLELQRPFLESQTRLSLSKQSNDQASEDTKLNKNLNNDKIAAQLPDLIRITAGSVQGIVSSIDPETASDEEVQTVLLQLDNLKIATLLGAQEQFGRTHTAEELISKGKSIFDLIDNRIAWVNGEIPKAQIEAREAAISGTAFNKLLLQPGVAENLAKLEALKGVSALISNIPALASRFKLAGLAEPGIDLVRAITPEGVAEKQTATPPTPTSTSQNFYDWMLNTISSAFGTDSYSSVATTAGDEAAGLHMKDVAYAIQANFDNNETVDILVDAMTKYTNGWQRAPQDIPMDVYDAFLDVVADDRWIKFRSGEESPILPQNLVSGFQEATQRMRNSLAGDIGQTLSIPLDLREVGGQLLIGEMLEVKVAADGSLAFLPAAGLEGDTNVLKAASALSRNYGTFFGKLVRAHSHVVFKDTDYQRSARAILATGEFVRAGTFGQEAAPVETVQDEQVEPTRVRRYNPATQKFESVQ
jgi:hypothetical protein